MRRRKTRPRPPVGRPYLTVDAGGKVSAPLVKERRALTDDFLEKLLAFPRYTTFQFFDTQTNGLQCRVGRHRATWMLYHDDRRHQRRRITTKRLGFFPAMRTAEARDEALIERGKIAAGDNGPGKKEAIKVDVSVTEYIARLERNAAKKGKAALWAKNVRSIVNKHIKPQWGSWTLADLATHPGAVSDWHRDVTDKSGPVVANQACKVLRAAYKRSARRDVSLPQRDPCSDVEYNPEKRSQNALDYPDYPKWRKAWEKIESPTRRAYQMIGLLSGCRPGELAKLKWTDVLPRNRCFVIRAAKADNDVRVPMSAAIARAFKLARDAGIESEWVFPARAGGHIAKFDVDGLPAWGMMYRRGWRTIAADLGVDELIAHFCLGHIPSGISRGYVNKMILSSGSAMRSAQRRVSRRIVQLLG